MSAVTSFDRWLAASVQRVIDPADIRLELWNGTTTWRRSRAIGDLVVRDRRALIGLALYPDLAFGEAFMAGRVEIRGNLRSVIEALTRHSKPHTSWMDRIGPLLAVPNTLRKSRHNVQHHYDLGNAFYQLWLDRELVYTCAYFESPDVTLEQAQKAKFELVCRKLRLTPGERVVEAGCGWGSLALYMARHYGVRVRAFNISREQLAHARERAVRENLADRVEFIDDDYRNVTGEFDAFVSVGMLEHVGLRHYPTLADVLQRTVRRTGGRGLLHFIGRDSRRPLNAWIRKRIFPGAYPPTLAEVASQVLTPAGLSILDVENLRLHYAQTLSHWGARFSSVAAEVKSRFGEEFRRAWELYLTGSEAAFATGWLQLFQVVFAPRESPPPYWTRAEIYERAGIYERSEVQIG